MGLESSNVMGTLATGSSSCGREPGKRFNMQEFYDLHGAHGHTVIRPISVPFV